MHIKKNKNEYEDKKFGHVFTNKTVIMAGGRGKDRMGGLVKLIERSFVFIPRQFLGTMEFSLLRQEGSTPLAFEQRGLIYPRPYGAFYIYHYIIISCFQNKQTFKVGNI